MVLGPLIVSLSLAGLGVVADPLVACDEAVAAEPTGRNYACYFQVAVNDDRIEDARERLASLLTVAPDDALAELYLAKLDSLQNRPGAEAEFRRAIEGLARNGDVHDEVYARCGLASHLVQIGRFDDAQTELKAASRVAEASGDAHLVHMVIVYREGHRVLLSKELGQAYTNLLALVPQLDDADPSELQLATMVANYLGAIAREIGRPKEAIGHYRRAAELARETEMRPNEIGARYNAVLVTAEDMRARGFFDPERVVPQLREVLDAAEEIGDGRTQAHAHNLLGVWLDGPEAVEHFERCIEISERVLVPDAAGLCRRGLAEAVAADDPERADALLEESMAIAREHDRAFEVVVTVDARAGIRWRQGRRQEAVVESLALLDAIETMRAGQADDLTRARISSAWASAYYRLSGRLLAESADRDDVALAFNVIERARARTLAEALLAAKARAVRPQTPEQPLVERVDTVRSDLSHRAAEGSSLLDDDFPTPGAVAEALAPDEAMVSFQLGDRTDVHGHPQGGSWAIVITKEGERVVPLGDQRDLEPAIGVYVGTFFGGGDPPAAATARIYDQLLAQVVAQLPPQTRHLVLVLDSAMHRLPMAALAPDGGTPLVARYSLSIAPSAKLWLRWRASAPSFAQYPAFVVADPTADPADVVAPIEDPPIDLGPAHWLARLPGTRREALAIADRLGESVRVVLGAAASEASLRRADLGNYGVLHVAAHAIVDDDRPERSGILLAPDGENDGLLRTREIVDLELDGHTVVLAACSSATGLALRGEGVLGLANGFFEAGATTVVASLWPLRDDQAAELFDDLYAELEQGRSVADAVALVQRRRIDAGAPAVTWAGLVVLGDGTRVPLPDTRGTDWHLGFAAAIGGLAIGGLAIAGFARSRRRRRRHRRHR